MIKTSLKQLILAITVASVAAVSPTTADACTAITLKAKDGSVLSGRTMEWGTFDLHGRIVVIPRGHTFTGQTPDKKPGLKWQAKYGVVGIDMLEKEILSDGMNEKGLVAALLYHPGFAEYRPYDPVKASESMAPTDVIQYLLTTCATLADVRAALEKIRVVPMVEPALGFPAPVHFIVTEPSGKQIVIEFLKGETTVTDAPLGVLTNAPTYDWHQTNLRNYINLSPVSLPGKEIGSLDFRPLGAGSGMIGLPGDFTSPSRFIRAVAFTATARPTEDGAKTTYEMFRILDNFNVPLGAGEGASPVGPKLQGKMRSSTLWTVVSDTKNKVIYYHTQHNRRVRQVNVGAIDFGTLKDGITAMPLDKEKAQDIEVVNPLVKK
jgi:choloylglycine hydrolase